MLTFSVGMLAGAVALAGFVGAARADTVRLIWQNTGTNLITNPVTSDFLVLDVILDVGPAGTYCGGVTVDYCCTASIAVMEFTSNPDNTCALGTVGTTTDIGFQFKNINGVQWPAAHANSSIRLGSIVFHKEETSEGEGSVTLSTLFTNTDSIRNVTSFGKAYLIVPEPGALLSLGPGLMLLSWLDRRKRRRTRVLHLR